MLSQEAIQKILDIDGDVITTPAEMAKHLSVTFFPVMGKDVDEEIIAFSDKLKKTFIELGVSVLDYESCLERVLLRKRVKRVVSVLVNNLKYLIFSLIKKNKNSFFIPFSSLKRIVRSHRLKRGISIIALGSLDSDYLPMQFISSFKSNSVIHIVKFPVEKFETSGFHTHYEKAMALFAHHMANIVIGVSDKKWILYNFNASHPIFDTENNFSEHVLKALIPKIYAPISPNLISEFNILNSRFSPLDKDNYPTVNHIRDMAQGLSVTGLFPEGKKINDLPFRDNFHKYIGKLHLDNRNGMSFGFIAEQMPTKLSEMIEIGQEGFEDRDKDYYYEDGKLFINIALDIDSERKYYSMMVPDVWVMTLRSGSNKTNFDVNNDLLKIGLVAGRMCMQFPVGVKITGDFKPSFDTKVILAQAVGNAIAASVHRLIFNKSLFAETIEKNGIPIVHWHGYINPSKIMQGVLEYGRSNPHVACSSPQSAIYSLSGKLEKIFESVAGLEDLCGHAHVEPHHGINLSHIDMISFIKAVQADPDITVLGNRYLIE